CAIRSTRRSGWCARRSSSVRRRRRRSGRASGALSGRSFERTRRHHFGQNGRRGTARNSQSLRDGRRSSRHTRDRQPHASRRIVPGTGSVDHATTTSAMRGVVHFIGMISRREFLDRSSRFALRVGVLRKGADLRGLVSRTSTQRSLTASGALQGRPLPLGNDTIAATWGLSEGSLPPAKLTDRIRRIDLPISSELFTLTLGAGPNATLLSSSAFRVVGDPRMETLSANPSASRFSERVAGNSVNVTLRDPDGRLEIVWRGGLRDGSAYVRQELSVRALAADVPLREISLFDFNAPRTWVSGTVRGTPIVVGDAYYAFEHPLANNGVDGDRVRCRMPRTLPLRGGATLEVSSVVGVTSAGQLRRDFLA